MSKFQAFTNRSKSFDLNVSDPPALAIPLSALSELLNGWYDTLQSPFASHQISSGRISMASSKPRVLVVDDNPSIRSLLSAELETLGYDVETVVDGQEAVERIGRGDVPIDLIIMDVMMPRMDGYQAATILKGNDKTRLIPIIMLTSLQSLEDKIKGLEAGVDEFLSKPFNQAELETRVRTLLKVKFLNDDLESSTSVVVSLALAVEARDPYTQGHSRHVGELAERMARRLGLPEEEQRMYKIAGFLHDVGKIGIPDAILQKPSMLTPEEYQIIIQHPVIGAKICEPLKLAKGAIPAIRHHHERFDGNGFPDKLKGEDIPVSARVIGLVDAYDAMVYDRPYRKGLPPVAAIANLEQFTGQLFDPKLLDIFKKMIEEEGPFNKDVTMPGKFPTNIFVERD